MVYTCTSLEPMKFGISCFKQAYHFRNTVKLLVLIVPNFTFSNSINSKYARNLSAIFPVIDNPFIYSIISI